MAGNISQLLLFPLLLLLLLLSSPAVSQDEEGEEHHSRVGDPKYWTAECFSQCYLIYLRCIGNIFPPGRLNNQEMVELFKNKSLHFHERIEACSAKYSATINIEDDDTRTARIAELNATVGVMSNFDLCVFTQCGAGGFYGSFNVNAVVYKTVLSIVNKKVDDKYDFYFQMNTF
ncbi:hypothetical protein BOX15_Mlig024324g1 [Macrostomum lignano]|uniref:Uncharacterized protein n=1 Tax=Macrostomum lignano TaxID=282301 RepID=A0A267ET88_9PLAT|nr:hypothetical protein BOX15_Mlig024324g2 [Macrostomum lignano]PAA63124.1 hypothetical protein BOX15_Mlig028037g1 [Macrostomum lignano]PAA64087.1 hypothetical protein BOX15_Mlig024324g1 [Macrostomum lignano]